MSLYSKKCPKCSKMSHNIVQDGGSVHCSDCDTTFHYCNGKIKYGSPGPIFCPYCKTLDGIINLPPIFYDY